MSKPSLWSRGQARLSVVAKLFGGLNGRGLLWLAPLILALILLGALLAAIASTGPLAPFLYPLL